MNWNYNKTRTLIGLGLVWLTLSSIATAFNREIMALLGVNGSCFIQRTRPKLICTDNQAEIIFYLISPLNILIVIALTLIIITINKKIARRL